MTCSTDGDVLDASQHSATPEEIVDFLTAESVEPNDEQAEDPESAPED